MTGSPQPPEPYSEEKELESALAWLASQASLSDQYALCADNGPLREHHRDEAVCFRRLAETLSRLRTENQRSIQECARLIGMDASLRERVGKVEIRATESLAEADRLQAELSRLRDTLRISQRDSERLSWLEKAAGGHPVEVDSFVGLNDPTKDRVFLTIYPGPPEYVHQLGAARTLRLAIDAAMKEAT
jgi:hypothetical protein